MKLSSSLFRNPFFWVIQVVGFFFGIFFPLAGLGLVLGAFLIGLLLLWAGPNEAGERPPADNLCEGAEGFHLADWPDYLSMRPLDVCGLPPGPCLDAAVAHKVVGLSPAEDLVAYSEDLEAVERHVPAGCRLEYGGCHGAPDEETWAARVTDENGNLFKAMGISAAHAACRALLMNAYHKEGTLDS